MQTGRTHLFSEQAAIPAARNPWPLASLPAWWRTFLFRLLNGRQLSVYLYLIWCMTDGSCYPSTSEISSYVGLSGPTMVFDALQALERYGLIVRERRLIAHLRSRRNVYRMPSPSFTLHRLIERGFLDTELRVRGRENEYDDNAAAELKHALHSILQQRFADFSEASEDWRKALLLRSLHL